MADEDTARYEAKREQNRQKGLKSAEMRLKAREQVLTVASTCQPRLTNTDSSKQAPTDSTNNNTNIITKRRLPDEKSKKHEYGEYKNVLLSDDELAKLQAEYPQDYQQRIERLSGYMASKGRSYKSHYATIRNWARKDAPAAEQVQKKTGSQNMTPQQLDEFCFG
jgi:hypothetical protein